MIPGLSWLLPVALLPALAGAAAAPMPAPEPERTLPAHQDRDAYQPAVAYGGQRFLVAWQAGRLAPGDLREGPKFAADIVAVRVDRSGRPLDSRPLVIASAPGLREQPRLAANGETFLAVWQDFRNGRDWDVYAARVSAAGRVLDPGGVLVSGGPHNQAKPAVAWDGRDFVVAWQDFRSGLHYGVYAARVTAAGRVLDPDGVRLAESPAGNSSSPAVAPAAGAGRAFALAIGGAGAPGASAPTAGLFLVDGKPEGTPAYAVINHDVQEPDGPHGSGLPATLAFGGDQYLLAWTTDSPYSRGNYNGKADMALLDRNGRQKLAFTLAGAQPEQRIMAPAAAWDGAGFVVAWHEHLAGPPGGGRHGAVFAARIAPSGIPAGPPLRLAGRPEAPALDAAVASDGAGLSLLVYEQHPERAETPILVGYRRLPEPVAPGRDSGGGSGSRQRGDGASGPPAATRK